MASPRPIVPITLEQIHRLVGGQLVGPPDAAITGVAALEEAGPDQLSFIASDRFLKQALSASPGALLTHRHLTELSCPQIVLPNPTLAFASVAREFFARPARPRGVAADLVRGEQVHIGKETSVWPFVTLGDRVRIGDRVTLYPGVFVGDDSVVGDDCILYPNVVVREGCTLGARVVVHSGTVIGSDGFGYVQHEGHHEKIPQLGGVTIEDDVEMGANVTVDRATLGQTVIKRGTKIDNLVQIAHNVSIGEHAILVAQVGIAGSTKIGHHVMIGGQAGLADHLKIGEQVMIAARTGVNRNLEPNQIVSGAPVMPHEVWVKAQAVIPRLPEIRQQVRTLEERLQALERRLGAARTGGPKRKKRSR